ncbi:MAG TPA: FAD-dependent oxidoreductase [Thermoanaerobaculia bacterium]|nr:FAD-dependent oxidoreductase [Thermoanaerobaculia bacterium]
MRRIVTSLDADVVVVGSGFGGSLTALVCRRLGLSTVLLERGRHPRFAIGESSSPLANLLLREIASRYGLPRVAPLAAWGSWKRERPELRCGKKRGFTFYSHIPGEAAAPRADRELLVAASPRDEVADTHWYRPDVDRFLAEEAASAGAEYLDEVELSRLERTPRGLRLEATRRGATLAVRGRLVVDASGPRGFLHRALGLGEKGFETLAETEALYAHFSGAPSYEDLGLVPETTSAPYHPDDAALHHLFPGGWVWVLRFDDGLVSAGVAAERAVARELRLEEGEPAWRRLLERIPALERHLGPGAAATPFFHRPIPFRSAAASGPGFLLLPSAAASIDPLLSTGFPLTLLGIERLGAALERDWGTPSLGRSLARIAALSLREADAAARLVGALYRAFGDPPLFRALALLYFAAASYAEAARRLGRPRLAESFLLTGTEPFGRLLRTLSRRAAMGTRDDRGRERLLDALARAIVPIDVAGLSVEGRTRFPHRAADLVASASKLGATAREAEAALAAGGL